MKSKVLLFSVLLMLLTGLFVAACAPTPPAPPPPPVPPSKLELRAWIDKVTFAEGEDFLLWWSINQTANVSLSIRTPAGVLTVFTNVLHSPGTYSYKGKAGAPHGSRTATFTAVSATGETTSASVTYTVGPVAPFVPSK